MPGLILASSSKARLQLLKRLHIAFNTEIPDVDETPLPAETPEELVQRLSVAKAQTIASRIQRDKNTDADSYYVIGSDQTLEVDGTLLGKPGSADKAIAQLTQCSGKSVTFYTGVCLHGTDNYDYAIVPTTVHFRDLTAEEIKRYVAYEKPFDCAGSFRSESLGISLFSSVRSEDPTALMGLPLITLCRFLRNIGVDIPCINHR